MRVVTPEDSMYGFDYEFRSAAVRVLCPVAGRLEVELALDGNQGLSGVAIGPLPEYPCCPARRSVQVAAGEEVVVHVLMSWQHSAPKAFVLRALGGGR